MPGSTGKGRLVQGAFVAPLEIGQGVAYTPAMDRGTFAGGLAFMKMQAAGNDFVVIDSRVPRRGQARDGEVLTPALARAIADRRLGVGCDQLAEMLPAADADLALAFWNADGSRAGACGNATRCVADFAMHERGAGRLSIRTVRGLLAARRLADGRASVNLGPPQTEWQDIPLAREVATLHLPLDGDPVAVGMGNPHCVFLVADAAAVDLATLGQRLEHDPLFPERTNVEFASLSGPDRLRLRVWERGAGVTPACGSGACAAAVAAHLRGLTGRCVTLEMDGGTLQADWSEDGVWLTGPVAHVFDGVLSPAFPGASA